MPHIKYTEEKDQDGGLGSMCSTCVSSRGEEGAEANSSDSKKGVLSLELFALGRAAVCQ